MGGGYELFEIGQQSGNFGSELKKIRFLVSFSNVETSLFDSYSLGQSITQEITTYFVSNKIQSEPIQVGGMGGGIGSFLEILRELWENKELISFVITLINFIKIKIRSRIQKNVKNLKPRIALTFKIESTSPINKLKRSDVEITLARCAANLLIISNSIAELTQENHKFLRCDFSINISITSKDFSYVIKIPEESRNSHNINKFLAVIKNIKVQTGLHSTYNIGALNLLQRIDWVKKRNIRYFFCLSTNIVNDFLKKY